MQILWSSPKASISTDRHSRTKDSKKKWTKVQLGYVLFLEYFPSLIILNIFLTARTGKYLDQPRALQLCIPPNQSGSIQAQNEKIISTIFSKCFSGTLGHLDFGRLFISREIYVATCNLWQIQNFRGWGVPKIFFSLFVNSPVFQFLHAVESNPFYSVV